jgi:hypothetical protein
MRPTNTARPLPLNPVTKSLRASACRATYRQKWWPVLSEVSLEIWVESDVARVIEEEIELSLIGSGSSHIIRIEVATVVRHERCIGDTMRVLPTYRFVWAVV